MRPAISAPSERTTHSQLRAIWFIPLPLGLLVALAFWLSGSAPTAQAQKPAQPDNAPSLPQTLIPLDGIVQVATGESHTCALTSGGGVLCWGGNRYGQLGDGTTVDKSTPMDVVGLASGVAAITAGDSHTCALTSAGGVKCWGRNDSGQLGDGTATERHSQVNVVGLGSGVVAITADWRYTCALTNAGGVKCWGDNGSGQLGDGTTVGTTTPIDVVGLGSGVAAIAAGYVHTCALTTAGGVKCWGDNGYGQLGDGTWVSKSIPVDVVGLDSGVAAIVAGFHTCALTIVGGVKCWGDNFYGQLGDGTASSQNNKNTPVNVLGLNTDVTAIAAGSGHTCALTTAGGVKCWGSNYWGQLGDGTSGSANNHSTYVDVVGLNNDITAIFAKNYAHTCALTTASKVKCWGYNEYGQLGDGTTENQSAPVDVLIEVILSNQLFLPAVQR